ncbi:hypothetical protein GCM10010124_16710 [Pilimelia terevasa]|uniref:Neocarzinostatin family protein n=1 Tax=Pilimelia terevasa TaxID=53372 RepID=A0A8J3FID4_9ACTN|nr:neocarzinostatin apoprotein domain-containing protein [Pilimelia terevasa]GGK24847.1 hypothetical protein GCM10010124_16710 [Pilimelia terevasa]
MKLNFSAAVAASAVALLVVGTLSAATRTTTPGLSATPADDLRDGAAITVQIRGFAPRAAVDVMQCGAATSACAREFNGLVRVRTDIFGTATATFRVQRTFVAVATEGVPSAALLDCRAGACAVVAVDRSDATAAATTAIAFHHAA